MGRDKEAMEEEYQKALEVVFAYRYGLHPEVPKGMLDSVDFVDPLPPKFFVNPGCPLVQAVVKSIATKAPPREMTKELMEVVAAEDESRL